MRLVLPPSGPSRNSDGPKARALSTLMGALGLSVTFYDRAGRVVRETPALTALLRSDPEEDRLRSGARRLALAALRFENGRRSTPHTELVTALGRYVLRAAPTGDLLDITTAAVVGFSLHEPSVLTDLALRERFGLTPRQVEVARLMGRGLSNASIGRDLAISHHTAERHVERVLRKLHVATRSAVAALLNAPGE